MAVCYACAVCWMNNQTHEWMRVFVLVPFVEWMDEWMHEQTHTQRIPWDAFLVPTLWSAHYTEGVFLTKVCGKKPVMVGVPSECSVRVPFKEVAVRNLSFVCPVGFLIFNAVLLLYTVTVTPVMQISVLWGTFVSPLRRKDGTSVPWVYTRCNKTHS